MGRRFLSPHSNHTEAEKRTDVKSVVHIRSTEDRLYMLVVFGLQMCRKQDRQAETLWTTCPLRLQRLAKITRDVETTRSRFKKRKFKIQLLLKGDLIVTSVKVTPLWVGVKSVADDVKKNGLKRSKRTTMRKWV